MTPLGPGETHWSDWSARAWLPRVQVAKEIVERLSGVDRHRVTTEMGVGDIDLASYVVCRDRDPAIEGRLLSGLTAAALNGNLWARSRVAAIGVEFGKALAAMIWAFREYDSMAAIVLTSTIGERLGLGCPGQRGGDDLLLESLGRSVEAGLLERGMGSERANLISRGIRRSKIGRERELLPFDPAYLTQSPIQEYVLSRGMSVRRAYMSNGPCRDRS